MEHIEIQSTAVSRGTFKKARNIFASHKSILKDYADRLLWWNQKVNLVSRSTTREELLFHVEHSLLPLCIEELDLGALILDSGTGGGLPGIPMAIADNERSYLLNDIATKKVMAVRDMKRQLNLSHLSANSGDLTSLQIDKPFTFISKHAFKIHWLLDALKEKPWQQIVLLKGRDFEEELNGISTPLSITVHDLEPESDSDFYHGKAILVIRRSDHSPVAT